jgi:DNA-directed RNA polymerase specialized sigma24 family protein
VFVVVESLVERPAKFCKSPPFVAIKIVIGPPLSREMNSNRELTETELSNLLSWLDPDREQAGNKYELIRRGLVKIFTRRGCFEAEQLADETINRVAAKAESLRLEYSGDPAHYFVGVAKRVYLEYQRKTPSFVSLNLHSLELNIAEPADELKFACLDRCMQQLLPAEREIVWHYYQVGVKAAQRDVLAKRLSLKLSTLRVKVFRLIAKLEKCVTGCIQQDGAE